MQVERTLGIVKPDGVVNGHIGHIVSRIEANGFRIVALRMLYMDCAGAQTFYHVHCDRGFFGELCDFMSSGPIVVLLLEGSDAIVRWREMMGPTDPSLAPPGTIRGDFGESISRNTVHGSDGADAARYEINFFFSREPRHP